ncbi:hypothetical protein [Chitinophaga sp.]|uniref:hypothetical protein n=1 Tax=Chitinophaga sp. TaxID=1869181 RepID=UPI002C816B75|nr:hypothetical protein [Chitinophaga sp.]HWV70017.1 hypothetical protein [Chitinophaga sp.]
MRSILMIGLLALSFPVLAQPGKAIEYRINFEVGATSFECFVNDIPVEQYFSEGNGTLNTSTPINDAILKSGTQHWKLVLYPSFKDGKQLSALPEKIKVVAEVEGLRKSDGEQVSNVELVHIDGDHPNASKTEAVYEGSFEAKVPYQLTGWSKSVNLQQEDEKALLAELLAAYESYAGCFRKKDAGALHRFIQHKEEEMVKFFYLDKEEAAAHLSEYSDDFKLDYTVLPIEKYRLRFYGNGKIAALERTDYPNTGEPVVRYTVKGPKGMETAYMYAYFHRPGPGAKLEMIR